MKVPGHKGLDHSAQDGSKISPAGSSRVGPGASAAAVSTPAALSGLVGDRAASRAPVEFSRRTAITAFGLASLGALAACGAPPPPKPAPDKEIDDAILQLSGAAALEAAAIVQQPEPADPAVAAAYNQLRSQGNHAISMSKLVDLLNQYRTTVLDAGLSEPKTIHDLRVQRDVYQLNLFNKEAAPSDAIAAAKKNLAIDKKLKVK